MCKLKSNNYKIQIGNRYKKCSEVTSIKNINRWWRWSKKTGTIINQTVASTKKENLVKKTKNARNIVVKKEKIGIRKKERKIRELKKTKVIKEIIDWEKIVRGSQKKIRTKIGW